MKNIAPDLFRLSAWFDIRRQRQDPNCQDADGHPAILVAAALGTCEIVEMLLKDSLHMFEMSYDSEKVNQKKGLVFQV